MEHDERGGGCCAAEYGSQAALSSLALALLCSHRKRPPRLSRSCRRSRASPKRRAASHLYGEMKEQMVSTPQSVNSFDTCPHRRQSWRQCRHSRRCATLLGCSATIIGGSAAKSACMTSTCADPAPILPGLPLSLPPLTSAMRRMFSLRSCSLKPRSLPREERRQGAAEAEKRGKKNPRREESPPEESQAAGQEGAAKRSTTARYDCKSDSWQITTARWHARFNDHSVLLCTCLVFYACKHRARALKYRFRPKRTLSPSKR